MLITIFFTWVPVFLCDIIGGLHVTAKPVRDFYIQITYKEKVTYACYTCGMSLFPGHIVRRSPMPVTPEGCLCVQETDHEKVTYACYT